MINKRELTHEEEQSTLDVTSEIQNTKIVVEWFLNNSRTSAVYNAVLMGGVNVLEDYTDEHLESDGYEVEDEYVDWEVAYLVIRDYQDPILDDLNFEQAVVAYMGVTLDDTDGAAHLRKSASFKAFFFSDVALVDVAKINNIPLRTLNDWFATRKIAFHTAVEYAKVTADLKWTTTLEEPVFPKTPKILFELSDDERELVHQGIRQTQSVWRDKAENTTNVELAETYRDSVRAWGSVLGQMGSRVTRWSEHDLRLMVGALSKIYAEWDDKYTVAKTVEERKAAMDGLQLANETYEDVMGKVQQAIRDKPEA